MSKVVIILSCCFSLLVLAGCKKQGPEDSNQPQLKSQAQDNGFPEVMVGVWEVIIDESLGSKWGIKFETDGSIKKIIHLLAGPVKMSEGGVYMEGPDPGTFAYFAMGNCESKYDPASEQLSVKIFLDEFQMQLPMGEIKGTSEDYFDGPVSQDGKTWTVSWRNYSWLAGGSRPDPNEVEAYPEKLVFKKIDLSKVK